MSVRHDTDTFVREWTIAMAESGALEEVLAQFAKEMLPYARAAARRQAP